jgi:hypothetical protein
MDMIIKLLRPIFFVIHKARNNYNQNYLYFEKKYNIVGYVGFFGFPCYYIIWEYIFEQPYENITLRVFGSFLCLILIKNDSLPSKIKPYVPIYAYISIIYCLPFFLHLCYYLTIAILYGFFLI